MNRLALLAIVAAVHLAACKATLRPYPEQDGQPPQDAASHDVGSQDLGREDVGSPIDRGAASDAALPPSCPAGKHSCPGGCVPDDDPRSCGMACTPCETPADGTATCDGNSCGGSCPSGKRLCQGACVDDGAACTDGCPAGRHACGGLCPLATDVKACGTSCLPCPVPANAIQATCNGTRCDFDCMLGFHRCGDRCAADSDPTGCGASCTACRQDPNGAAACVAGNCTITCASGYHLCGQTCVSNTSPDSCGTSCDPCGAVTGGVRTCAQGKCGGMCPPGKQLCEGACIDLAAPCAGTCPGGQHDCGGVCSSNSSVNSCGTLCTSCPRPTGASAASCNGTACDFTCGAGYHRCGDRCAADDDATACGSTCRSCPTDPNGAPACQLGVCALMCSSGYHLCGGRCVSNRDPATCGPMSCNSPCQAPSGGGTVTCDGLACAYSCPSNLKLCNGACIAMNLACGGNCPSGSHNCSGLCQPDSSTSYCGAACTSCSAPPSNGSAACNGGSCAIACNSGYKNCPGTTTCVPSAACCTSTDCTGGGPGATPTCNGGACSYPCAANFKMCGAACIASSACCGDADCTNPNPICNTSTHACGPCTAVAAAALHYVDPGMGFDDANHGGSYGRCGYKTLAYALGQASGQIALQTGVYSLVNGAAVALTGQQQLLCKFSTSASATIKGMGGDASGVTTAVSFRGSSNALYDCIVDGAGGINPGAAFSAGICVNVAGPGAAAPMSHVISGSNIGNCGQSSLSASVVNLQITGSTFHDNARSGLGFGAGVSGISIQNNTFSGQPTDVECGGPNPGVTGSGNRRANGAPIVCTSCANCPF